MQIVIGWHFLPSMLNTNAILRYFVTNIEKHTGVKYHDAVSYQTLDIVMRFVWQYPALMWSYSIINFVLQEEYLALVARLILHVKDFSEYCIALVKVLFFNPKVLIFFLFLHKNICCGYSLEAPQRREIRKIGEIRKIFTGYRPISRPMVLFNISLLVEWVLKLLHVPEPQWVI